MHSKTWPAQWPFYSDFSKLTGAHCRHILLCIFCLPLDCTICANDMWLHTSCVWKQWPDVVKDGMCFNSHYWVSAPIQLLIFDQCRINSLGPGRCGTNFNSVSSERMLQIKLTHWPLGDVAVISKLWFLKLISWTHITCAACKIVVRWIPQNSIDDKSTLVQVMARCRQVTSHHLSQCWPRSMSPYGVTRLQWVNEHFLWNCSQVIATEHFDDNSTFFQVLTWCHQAKPLQSQFWYRFMLLYRNTGPQEGNTVRLRQNDNIFADNIFKCIF